MWPWAAQDLVSCLQFIQLYHLPALWHFPFLIDSGNSTQFLFGKPHPYFQFLAGSM